MTAENRRRRRCAPGVWRCFNEAAADDRGKPFRREVEVNRRIYGLQ